MANLSSWLRRYGWMIVGLLLGIAIWEVVGWQLSSYEMAPFFGSNMGDVAEGLAPLSRELGEFSAWLSEFLKSSFGVPEPEGDEHPGTIPWLVARIANGEFHPAVLESMQLFFTGFVISLGAGVTTGIFMARFQKIREGIEPYVLILYTTPMIALYPFILFVIGAGFWPKVLIVFLFGFFPILYNTLEGARSLKPELLEVARAFRSSEYRYWVDVLVPYTLPFALTGMKQAVGRAMVGMIAAEFFLSGSGLGLLIRESEQNADLAGVLGSIMATTIVGVSLMGMGRYVEVRFAGWRGTNR